MKRAAVLTAAATALYVWMVAMPAARVIGSAERSLDYATYHYAVAEAWGGGDPYETEALTRRARDENLDAGVHPYIYPPPFLLGVAWAVPMDRSTGHWTLFWFNQACLCGIGLLMWRWFRARPVILALLATTFTPIAANLSMGQVNLPVLLLVVAGFGWRRGEAIGAAAMAKMSPALYLLLWAVQRRWRPVATACITAVGLSILALPLVGFASQARFYTEVMPGFVSGNYHGLSVPINIPGNHSLPELLNQWRVGPDGHTLAVSIRVLSVGITLTLLTGLLLAARKRRDPLGQAALAGAFTTLLLVTPVYTYGHHMVLLLLPLGALGTALLEGRLHRGWVGCLGPAYFFLASPRAWQRALQQAIPDLEWALQESRFFAAVLVGVACVVIALASPEDHAGSGVSTPPSPEDEGSSSASERSLSRPPGLTG